jgi:hypothetical protein
MYTKKCRRFGKDSSCTFREITRCPKNELSTSLCGRPIEICFSLKSTFLSKKVVFRPELNNKKFVFHARNQYFHCYRKQNVKIHLLYSIFLRMSKSDGSQFLKDAFNVSMQGLVIDEEESKSSLLCIV